MSEEETVVQLEISIEQANQLIKDRDDLYTLIKHPLFSNLVSVGYFEKEASNLVLRKAESNTQSNEAQDIILKQIDAVGMFRQYLRGIIKLGDMAEKDKHAAETAKDEILGE